ncbi:MAG: alpha/beta fold hydrolase [Candidatus Limnocylindrales bacterium]
MPQVRANGLDVAYEVVGEGPPLVLLHGASSGGRLDFGHQLARFRRDFTCYLPDARGHGGTRWDAANGFSYLWLVDDAIAFADALGLGAFHLAGFSMGGATALGVASRQPERVLTLVVMGITPEREPRTSVARGLFDADRIKRTQPDWAEALDRRHDPVQGEGGWERLLPEIAAAISEQDLLGPAELRWVDAPTLVIAGDRDPLVPVDHAWALKRQLPDARLLIVPDCPHEVTARRPGIVNEALAGFYRSTEATAAARAERYVSLATPPDNSHQEAPR